MYRQQGWFQVQTRTPRLSIPSPTDDVVPAIPYLSEASGVSLAPIALGDSGGWEFSFTDQNAPTSNFNSYRIGDAPFSSKGNSGDLLRNSWGSHSLSGITA